MVLNYFFRCGLAGETGPRCTVPSQIKNKITGKVSILSAVWTRLEHLCSWYLYLFSNILENKIHNILRSIQAMQFPMLFIFNFPEGTTVLLNPSICSFVNFLSTWEQ